MPNTNAGRIMLGFVPQPNLRELALNQNQPLANSRFYAKIEIMAGQRREAKPRGRPRVEHDESAAHNAGQGKLGL